MPATNAELASAYISLIPSFKGAEGTITQGMAGVGQAAGQKATGGFLSTIGGIAGKVVGIAGAGVAAIGGLVGGMAIKGGIARQLNIENATTKLEGLKLSTKSVETVMGNALTSVKGTAFGLGDAATVAAGAIGAAVQPGKQLTGFLKLTADAATQAGIGLNDMGQMMNKVQGQGKLTGDVVQQMAENGLYVMPMLAKSYGVSQEAMTKMVSAGKVDAATFQRVLEENVGGSALKSGNTTVGSFDNMGAALSRVGVTLTSGFFPMFKTVFQQATVILDGLNERIGPVMTRFNAWFSPAVMPFLSTLGTRVLSMVDETVGGVRAMVAAFKDGGDEITSSGFAGGMERIGVVARNAWDLIKPVLVAIGNGFKSLFDGVKSGNFEGVGGNIGKVFSALQNLAAPMGSIMVAVGGNIGAVGTQIGLLVGNALPLLAPLIQIAADAMGFLADHTGLLAPIIIALAAAFTIYRVGQTAANFAEIGALPIKAAMVVANLALASSNRSLAAAQVANTGTVVANTASRLPAVAQVIAHTIAFVAHAVAMTAVRAAMIVATAAQWLWNAAMSANPIGLVILAIAALVAAIIFLVMNWDSVVSFVTTIWGGFISWLTDIVNAVAGWWNGVWAGIVSFFTDVWNNIVLFVRISIVAFQIIIRTGMQIARDVITNILTAVGNFFTGIFNFYLSIVRNVFNFIVTAVTVGLNTARSVITNVLNAIGGFFSNIFNAYLSTVRNVFNFIVSAISGGLSTARSVVSGALGAIASFFSNTWNGIVNGVSGAIGRVVGFFSGLAGQVIGAIGNIGGTLFNIGSSIIQSLYDGLLSTWGKVTDFVGGIASWIAEHKGPLSLDRVLLVPAGRAIMGGLIDSTEGEIPALEDTLNRVTATVTRHHVGQLQVGRSGADTVSSVGAQVEQAGGVRKGPTVNYNDKVYGFDPDEAPKQWEQDLADAAAVAGLGHGGKEL